MGRTSSDIEEMRLRISQVYTGIGWKRKCQHMGKDQVIAIYKKFEAEGRFQTKQYKSDKKYHQISILEYMKDGVNDGKTSTMV